MPERLIQLAGSAEASRATMGRARSRRSSALIEMRWVGAAKSTQIEGQQPVDAHVNYFIGSDPRRWSRNVPAVRQILQESIWPGIGARYHGSANGHGGQIECDFLLATGR